MRTAWHITLAWALAPRPRVAVMADPVLTAVACLWLPCHLLLPIWTCAAG